MSAKSLQLLQQVLQMREWAIADARTALHGATQQLQQRNARHEAIAGELQALQSQMRLQQARGAALQIDKLARDRLLHDDRLLAGEQALQALDGARAEADTAHAELAALVAERQLIESVAERFARRLREEQQRIEQREGDERHAARLHLPKEGSDDCR